MKIANIIRNPRGALKHLALALTAGAAMLAGTDQALAVTETAVSDNFSQGSNGYQANVPEAALNLLALPGTTLTLSNGAPANPPDGGGGTSTNWSVLTDGSFGLVPPGGGGGPGEVAIWSDWTLTYNFGTAQTIGDIDVFSGWGDGGRKDPNVTIKYSTNGVDFTELYSINYNASGNSAWVRLTDSVVPGVVAVQFAFGSQQNGYVGYTELCVQSGAPPTVPVGVAAVPGDGQITVSWLPFPDATGYNLRRSLLPGGPYTNAVIPVVGTSYADTGLTNGTPYYYVVTATLPDTTETDASAEVSATPSELDANLSAVVGYLPEVWSDGVATSTVTVTLRNGGGIPVAGKDVTLAASGTAVVTPTAPIFVTTDANGVATFTVTCTDPGLQEFTATAGTGAGPLVIAQTGKVLFKTKPADLEDYVPTNLPAGGAVNVLKTWNSGTGWSDWSNWDGGNSYDVYNNKVLGRPNPGGQRGAMYINDTRTSPGLSSMSYFDSGLEITYIGASARMAGDAATYAEMLTWDGDVPGQPRQGFIVDAPGGSGSTGDGVRTWQMLNDSNRVEDWSDTDLDGLHTMTLLRLSNGDVQTYVDGVLKYTMLGTVDPTAPLTKIAFGFEFSGNHYIQPGTIVQQVKAFTVSYPVGNPSAGNSTVVATPAAMPANGTDTSTVTVTLKDAANNRVAGKEVTLSYTGPGAVTITPSAQTSGAAGTAVFTVQPTTTTPGIYEFTATVTDPAVEITQKAILNTTLVLSQTALDVSASGTGLEILNDGTLVEANHFGGNGVAPVTLDNGLTLGVSTTSMTGWDQGAWGGQNTTDDGQGLVDDALDPGSPFGKLMTFYRWSSVQTASAAIPGLTVGHTYRLQWITSGPRGGNISVEGSASMPLTGNTDAPTVLSFTWQATDTTANILVTRQNSPYYGGSYDSEMLWNGYALHDVSGGGNTGFASWAAAQSPEVTGGPYGDSDNDSIPNLVEYALNLNPAASDGAPGTLTGRVISFSKRAEAVANGDVTYEIETSPDLNNPWTTVTPDSNDGTTINYTLPAGEEAIFGRLKVTIPSLVN